MSEQTPAPDADDGADTAAGAPGNDLVDGMQPDATAPGSSDARVVGLESADAAEVIGAVGSDTAREVLEALHDDPGSASDLADRVDCSLQTVQYHLGNLSDAGLVEVVDRTTSGKGREMDVHGPASRPVVVYAGNDESTDLRSMLRRLVPAGALLALASLVVQWLLAPEETTADQAVTLTADSAGETAPAAGVEPGLLFFAGGVVVLSAYLGWWHLRRRGYLEGRGLPV